MFFIDFHAPCGVLGVEHPDTFSPVLLAAEQALGSSNIVTAAPVAANLAYGATPDLPPFPQRIESSQPMLGAESLSTSVTPDFPKPKIESLLLSNPDFPTSVGPDFPKPR